MRNIHVPDVGPGLAAKFTTISGRNVQIDCGSLDNPNAAYECSMGTHGTKPSVFFLSHFHKDHYNGLVTAPDSSQFIKKVVFPDMPDHKKSKRFLESIFTMDMLNLAKQTGSWPGDLYKNILRINTHSDFEFKAVSKGNSVQVGSTQFDVLWPPDNPSEHTIKPLVDGVELFDEALKKDEQLREIYEEVASQEMVEPFLADEERHPDSDSKIQDIDDFDSLAKGYEPSEAAEDAYDKLSEAADRMSLAMYVDNRLLFMGDLKKTDIKDVVEQLLDKNRNYFYILITPHHGTRWDDNMNKIRTVWAVSSAGGSNLEYLDSRYRCISDQNWVTHLNGDFIIPTHVLDPLHVPREY